MYMIVREILGDRLRECTRYAAYMLRPAGLEIRGNHKYAYVAWNELHVKVYPDNFGVLGNRGASWPTLGCD